MKGDKNNIFFNMIHYVLSEQSNVSWILKSSFINFTGLQTEVSFSKFQKPNLVNDILEYVTHVKPYHTKFDQFIEKYTSKNDKVRIQGDRKEAADGTFIVIQNLVEFFNITHKMRFDNVTLTPDIETYNNLPNSKSAQEAFWDTTSANRLYANVTKDLDKISEILKGGFKGLTIDGGDFLIDAYGYDSRAYDDNLYDAPNITNEYFIVDYTDNEYTNYTKTFTKIQLNLLKTNHPYKLTKSKIKIYSYYNGIRTEIIEYNIIDDIVNIFKGIREYEKIVITVSETDTTGSIIKYNYIFVGIPFVEEVSDSGIKTLTDYGTTRFKMPDAEYGLKSMRVYKTDKNGNKELITDYIKDGDYIQLPNIPDEFTTISITIVDYSFLYDKIYSYEDIWASQNNLMYIDGEGFLRPHWDKFHPSELTISRCQDFLFINKYENNTPKEQHYIDVWRNNTYADWDNGENTILTRDLNIGDKQIYVKNGKVFEKPYIDSNGIKVPGVLCIEDEIIEFYHIEGNVLSSIKRASRGSSFKQKYTAGSVCWNYGKNNTIKKETTFRATGYTAYPTKLSYEIPADILDRSEITVYKTKRVNMLNNLTPDSQYVNFDKPVLATTAEVKITYTVDDFFKIANGAVLGIKLGEINEPIIIYFEEDVMSIQDVVKYINNYIPSGYTLKVTTDGETITFTSYAGNSLLIYNVNGYPVQELFDCTLISSIVSPTVYCNGVNGIIINGNKVIWGNHAHTIKWLKEHPYEGDVNEMILSINKNNNLKKQIISRNNDNRLEIVSINGSDLRLEEVGETTLDSIGMQPYRKIPAFIHFNENYNSLVAYQEKATNAGSVVINGKTIYFYVYTEYADETTGEIYSRIEDIRTDQTINADEAIITTPAVYELYKDVDYTIEGNKVVLLEAPKDYEAVYVVNNWKRND